MMGATDDNERDPNGIKSDLASAQAAVVAAVTGTGTVPKGFDPILLEVARKALLRKRSGEIAARWPLLAAGLGAELRPLFAQWAERRPTQGSLRDGASFATYLLNTERLPRLARIELAQYRALWRERDGDAPSPRRSPVLVDVNGVKVFAVLGRTWTWRQ